MVQKKFIVAAVVMVVAFAGCTGGSDTGAAPSALRPTARP
jgi:hypothetical protein